MADNMQSLGLDASEFIAALTKSSAALKAYGGAIEEVLSKTTKFDAAGNAIRITSRLLMEDQSKMEVVLKKSATGWDSYVKSVTAAKTAHASMASAGSQASAFIPKINAAELNTIRSQLQAAFTIPTGASVSSIAQYQAAINALMGTLNRGKVSASEFSAEFAKMQASGGKAAFDGQNQSLGQVHAQLQRVQIAQNNMASSAQAAGNTGSQAARQMIVTWERLAILLQVQLVHRFFGALITGIQQSIGESAKLSVKIAEVMTVSQGSGIDRGQMEGFIRQQSEAFGKPQTDVTEGLYKAFSSQMVRTAADLANFEVAMKLARSSVTSTADTVSLLSGVMRAYNLTQNQVIEAGNSFQRVVELGRLHLGEFASTFGRISVVGSQLGVSLTELQAIFVQLSNKGLQASETETQISAVMNSLMRPSTEMKKLLTEWGFASGEAAVKTLTLVGVLQKLNAEVASGRHQLPELTPNIRAIRGLTGVGNTQELQGVEQKLGEPTKANEIISKDTGQKFEQEITKIKNNFLDLGKTIVEEIQKMAAPWGGFAELLKSAASAFGPLASALKIFIDVLNESKKILGLVGADIGTVIKLYIDYKAVMLAWTAVQAIANVMTADQASKQLANMGATGASTVTVGLHTAATTANAAAQTAANAATTFGTTTVGAHAAALNVTTTATTAATAATGAFATAMSLVPGAVLLIALGAAVAYLTGQFDPLINKINGTTDTITRLQDASKVTQDVLKGLRDAQSKDIADQEKRFNDSVQRAERSGGAVFAELTRRANQLVEAQKILVESTTENLRVALRGASDSMAHIISDLNRQISEARRNIELSVKRSLSFGDRDQLDAFKRNFAQIKAPEYVAPIEGKDEQDKQKKMQEEERKFQGEAQKFAQQKEAITKRIAELEQQARTAAARGDEAGMEQFRRKMGEVRQLTEQMGTLQADFNRRTAEHQVQMGRVPAGAQINYAIPDQGPAMQRITDLENRGEQAFQRQQASRRAAAQAELERQRAIQKALMDSIKALESFNVMQGQGNRLKNEYAGGQAGLERFDRDAAAQRERITNAMNAANTPAGERTQILDSLAARQRAQRLEIEKVVQQQALQNIREQYEERLRQQQRVAREASDAQTAANAARNNLTGGLDDRLKTMRDQVGGAIQTITGLNPVQQTASRTLLPTGADAQQFNRIEAAQNVYRQREADVATAQVNFNRSARGPGREEAERNLQLALQRLNESFVNIFRLAGNRNLGAAFNDQTGNQLRTGGTTLGRDLNSIQTTQDEVTRTQRELAEANREVQRTNNEMVAAGGRLGIGFDQLGAAAGSAVQPVRDFGTAVDEAARRLRELAPGRGQGPRAAADLGNQDEFGQPAPEAFTSFAEGGLIGGRFNSFGPDNMLAAVRTGEFIVNPESTSRFYSQLVALNSGSMPSFASGGAVGSSSVTTVGDIAINVHDSGDPNATARAVLGTLRRELRRGNGRLE